MRRAWSKEQVLAIVQERFQQGLPLIRFSQEVRSLGYFARQHFGGWYEAVAAAGIPDGWQHKWSRERVIEALRACARPGQPLTRRHVSAAVHGAAFYHFGTWHNALAAAGLVPLNSASRQRWNRGIVLAEIGPAIRTAQPPKVMLVTVVRARRLRTSRTILRAVPRPPARQSNEDFCQGRRWEDWCCSHSAYTVDLPNGAAVARRQDAACHAIQRDRARDQGQGCRGPVHQGRPRQVHPRLSQGEPPVSPLFSPRACPGFSSA
jgi:hypothetical protein